MGRVKPSVGITQRVRTCRPVMSPIAGSRPRCDAPPWRNDHLRSAPGMGLHGVAGCPLSTNGLIPESVLRRYCLRPTTTQGRRTVANRDQTITIEGGRSLGYREFGRPDGAPVVNCHGGLLCGLDVAAFDDTARELGVRVISPDRPGIGASDPSPDRTTGDWADDVAVLLDALAIDQAAVLGWSMGGQYALACAAKLGDRVSRTTVIAAAVPLDDQVAFSELNAMDRRLTRLSQHHQHVASATFRALGEIARHSPDVWAHLTTRGAVPEEADALEALPDHGIADAAAVALAHGEGMVEEYRAWVRPWGFSPDDVVGEVTIWQGDADELVPPKWAEELARQIPNAHLELLEGEGHFLGYRHQDDVLRSLTG
jgi:pimeloyl-ACP methyl ester carboxylesterase